MESQLSETLETESKPVDIETLDISISAENSSSKSEEEEEEEEDMDSELDSSLVRRRRRRGMYPPYSYYHSSYYRSHWAHPWGTSNQITHSNSSWAPSPDPEDQSSSPHRWLDGPSIHETNKPVWDSHRYEVEEATDNLSMLGAGLANLGNTCFLNAVLQSFMHTVPLIQGLRSSDHATPCDSYLRGFCAICALRELIDASLVSEAGVVSPWKFVNSLNYFSSTFHRFQQEDAHEFLQCFLDKLEKCCDDSRPIDCSPSENENIVKQAFGGRLVSKLQCCNCGHCSDTYETLIDLSLEIEDVDSLLTALESFTKVEKIEDSEIKFTCEECKEHVTIEKQLLLKKAPSVASLHLKRFKTDGSLVEKIDKFVSFPLELDLLAYADNNQNNNESMKYDLYAVIVHTGFSYCSGHYYSFICSAPNEWYKFDDSKVVRVREDFVLSQEAYILLYAKRGTPWFSEFIEKHKPFIDPSILNTSPKSVLDNTNAVYVTSPHMPDTKASCVEESNDAADESSPNSINKFQDTEGKENVQMSTPKSVLDNKNAVYSTSLHMPDTEASCVKESNDVADESSPSSLKKFQDSEGKENVRMMSTSVPHGSTNILDSESHEVGKLSSPSVLEENHSILHPGATSKTVYISPKTPPRSPSPEIYREEPRENDFYIPRSHLRSADQVSCKKQQQKELEQDMERKQACSLIKKNMCGSRAQQLLAAMRGSRSEGSANKKRRRMEVSPTRDDSTSTSRRSGSMFRTVMAGSMT